jgi:hypothetical protein
MDIHNFKKFDAYNGNYPLKKPITMGIPRWTCLGSSKSKKDEGGSNVSSKCRENKIVSLYISFIKHLASYYTELFLKEPATLTYLY